MNDAKKLSKSARRRARKKAAVAGDQTGLISDASNEVEKIKQPSPATDGTRQLTISLKPRHWEVFDWLCGGLGPEMQSEAATKMIRQFCIKELPRWRNAQGMEAGSVRAEDFKKPE